MLKTTNLLYNLTVNNTTILSMPPLSEDSGLTWQPSLVVKISVLIVQVPMLVVLLVELLHALLWPQTSGWWVQVFLGVVDPLGKRIVKCPDGEVTDRLTKNLMIQF